jgi:hypothetical protein
MSKALSTALLSSVAAMIASHASAQALDNYFKRDRNMSVLERPHPGYIPLGMRLGAFLAYPKIELGVLSNDNIYATASNKHADTIGLIAPEVDLVSNWSRNQVMLFARGATRQYSKYNSESTTDWQLGGAGRLDAGDSSLNLLGDYGYFAEPRYSTQTSGSSKHPIEYHQGDLGVNLVHTFNRVRLTGGVNYQDLNYENGRSPTGGLVLQDDRDHTVTTVMGKAEYAVSPDTAVFVQAAYNEHTYRLHPPAAPINRNDKGETIDFGANFDISHLIRGEVAFGWLDQKYSAKGFGSTTGAHITGKIDWFPTQLTTVTFTGARSVQDAAIAISPAYTASIFGGEIDHELLRNVVLTGRVGWEGDEYKGIDRNDNITTAHAAVNYLMNRHVGFSLAYDYQSLDSDGKSRGPHYVDNLIKLSSTLQY